MLVSRSLELEVPGQPLGGIYTPPSRIDVLHALASDAAVHFDDGDVNIVNCLAVKGHQQNRVLAAHGFLDSRVKVHLF